MITKTLRIKKVFFDQILAGEKTYEYRSGTPYYQKFFDADISALKLHYQYDRRHLIVAVHDIELIDKPEHLQSSPYLSTDQIYKITLGSIIKYESGAYEEKKPTTILRKALNERLF